MERTAGPRDVVFTNKHGQQVGGTTNAALLGQQEGKPFALYYTPPEDKNISQFLGNFRTLEEARTALWDHRKKWLASRKASMTKLNDRFSRDLSAGRRVAQAQPLAPEVAYNANDDVFYVTFSHEGTTIQVDDLDTDNRTASAIMMNGKPVPRRGWKVIIDKAMEVALQSEAARHRGAKLSVQAALRTSAPVSLFKLAAAPRELADKQVEVKLTYNAAYGRPDIKDVEAYVNREFPSTKIADILSHRPGLMSIVLRAGDVIPFPTPHPREEMKPCYCDEDDTSIDCTCCGAKQNEPCKHDLNREAQMDPGNLPAGTDATDKRGPAIGEEMEGTGAIASKTAQAVSVTVKVIHAQVYPNSSLATCWVTGTVNGKPYEGQLDFDTDGNYAVWVDLEGAPELAEVGLGNPFWEAFVGQLDGQPEIVNLFNKNAQAAPPPPPDPVQMAQQQGAAPPGDPSADPAGTPLEGADQLAPPDDGMSLEQALNQLSEAAEAVRTKVEQGDAIVHGQEVTPVEEAPQASVPPVGGQPAQATPVQAQRITFVPESAIPLAEGGMVSVSGHVGNVEVTVVHEPGVDTVFYIDGQPVTPDSLPLSAETILRIALRYAEQQAMARDGISLAAQIPPPWMIEELEKMRKKKEEQKRQQPHAPAPQPPPSAKQAVDPNAKEYYHDYYGEYGDKMTREVPNAVTDRMAMVLVEAEAAKVALSDNQVLSIVAFLQKMPEVHGAFERYAQMGGEPSMDQMVAMLMELSQSDRQVAKILDKVTIQHMIRTSDALNRMAPGEQQVILERAIRTSPHLYKKLLRLYNKHLGVPTDQPVAPAQPEIMMAAMKITAAGMKTPKPKGQPDDAVDVIKLEDVATDEHTAPAGHIPMTYSDPVVKGVYTYITVSWDPEDVHVGGQSLMLAIRRYVVNMASHKEPIDWGLIGPVHIDDVDPQAGVATVHFRTGKPGNAPVQVQSKE
jgi:hypothetical protein